MSSLVNNPSNFKLKKYTQSVYNYLTPNFYANRVYIEDLLHPSLTGGSGISTGGFTGPQGPTGPGINIDTFPNSVLFTTNGTGVTGSSNLIFNQNSLYCPSLSINNTGSISYSNTGFIFNQNLIPSITNAYSLGTPEYRWNNIYLNTGSIHIGNDVVLDSQTNNLLNINGGIKVINTGYFRDIVMTGSINSPTYIDFSTGPNPTWKEGRVFYDYTNKALSVYNSESDITLQIGQEEYVYAFNDLFTTILNGTPVRVIGAQGDHPSIQPAISSLIDYNNLTGNHIIGLATHDIPARSLGFVTTYGTVNGLNTNSFNAGDFLYVSQNTGTLTNIAPTGSYEVISVGVVTRKNTNNGSIFVRPIEPSSLNTISGVDIVGGQPLNNQVLIYNTGSNTWTNITIENIPYLKVAGKNNEIIFNNSGSYTGSSNLKFNGDTLTINNTGSISYSNTGFIFNSNLIPSTTNTYDLGSTGYRWNSLYVNTGSIHIGDSIILSSKINNILDINSEIQIKDSLYISTGTIIYNNTGFIFNDNLIPSSNNITLGNIDNPWSSIYVNTGTIFIGQTGSLGLNSNGVVYSAGGFATPFLTIGGLSPGTGVQLYTNNNRLWYINQFGASGPVDVWRVSDNNVNNISFTGGNVGINTISPNYLLDVNGTGYMKSIVTVNESIIGNVTIKDSNKTGSIVLGSNSSAAYTNTLVIGNNLNATNTGTYINFITNSTGSHTLLYDPTTKQVTYNDIGYLFVYSTGTQSITGTNTFQDIFLTNVSTITNQWSHSVNSASVTGSIDIDSNYFFTYDVQIIAGNNNQTIAFRLTLDGNEILGSYGCKTIGTVTLPDMFSKSCMVHIPKGNHTIKLQMASTTNAGQIGPYVIDAPILAPSATLTLFKIAS